MLILGRNHNIFLAMPCNLQDLSSPTRDPTWPIGESRILTTGPPGNALQYAFKIELNQENLFICLSFLLSYVLFKTYVKVIKLADISKHLEKDLDLKNYLVLRFKKEKKKSLVVFHKNILLLYWNTKLPFKIWSTSKNLYIYIYLFVYVCIYVYVCVSQQILISPLKNCVQQERCPYTQLKTNREV